MEKHRSLYRKKGFVIYDLITDYIQNTSLNWIYDKTNMNKGIIIACDVLTSFNKMEMIQTLLLQSGKYKLYLFLMYVIMLA